MQLYNGTRMQQVLGRKSFASILSAFSIVIGLYSFSFFPKLSLAYLLFLVLVIGFFLNTRNIITCINLSPLVLALILTFLSFVTIILQSSTPINYSRMVLYTGKLLLWACVLSLLITKDFDQKIFYNLVLRIALLATLYMYLQLASFIVFGIRLPNRFAFGFVHYQSEEALTALASYRPYSFFVEPAYYGTYVICVLAAILFDEIKVKKNKLGICIFLTVGAIMSTSTSVIVMLGVLYSLYSMHTMQIMGLKNIRLHIIVLAIILIAAVIGFITSYEKILPLFGSYGKSILSSLYKLQRLDSSARVGGSFIMLESVTKLSLVWGSGIGNEYYSLGISETYMNSVVRLILNNGYVGFAIFLIYLMYLFFKFKDYLSWFYLILYASKCFSGNAMFSLAGIYMLTFLYLRHINLRLKVKSNFPK